jgi:hypothetical protein
MKTIFALLVLCSSSVNAQTLPDCPTGYERSSFAKYKCVKIEGSSLTVEASPDDSNVRVRRDVQDITNSLSSNNLILAGWLKAKSASDFIELSKASYDWNGLGSKLNIEFVMHGELGYITAICKNLQTDKGTQGTVVNFEDTKCKYYDADHIQFSYKMFGDTGKAAYDPAEYWQKRRSSSMERYTTLDYLEDVKTGHFR